MSVCASANPFNSRPVTTAGRRPAPLANDERWVALNKNIFQDILNAILIQTTFSSAASAGKRHLSTRPEVSLHSPSSPSSCAASPLSFTTSDASATPNPISGLKDGNRRDPFDPTTHDVISAKNEAPDENSFLYEAAALQDGRTVGERETLSGHGNGRYPAPLEVKKPLLKGSGNLTAIGDIGEEGSKGNGGSEIVCSSRPRDNISSAFSRVGAYDQSSLGDSHLSVYCQETYVGKVPMMIIGLRPYIPSDTKLSCLIEPTNQISLHSKVLKKCPTEISASSGLHPLNGGNADLSSSLLPANGRRDQYDRCAKMTGRFLSPPPTNQLHINTAGGVGGAAAAAKSNGQKSFRGMYYPDHHSESAREPSEKSSLKLSPAEAQSNCETATNAASHPMTKKTSTAAEKDFGRKSSRDHSILTILGLLSSTDDEEEDHSRRKQSPDVKSGGGGGGGGVGCEAATGLDKNRLLGIGVTVIGRSRWMAVDKGIVYDMIDQVLNGERDYFTTDDDDSLYSPPAVTASRCDVSRPQMLVSSQMVRRCGGVFSDGLVRKRSHHLPRMQRNGSTISVPRIKTTTSHEVKRKMECGIEGDLKQNHDIDLLPSSSSSSSSSSCFSSYSSSFVSPTTKMSSSQERPINFKPMRTNCESPAAAKDILSGSKSIEGVSVLRSLLSDDPVEVCHGGPSATESMTPHLPLTNVVGDYDATKDTEILRACTGRVKASDFSKMPADDLRRVKRSRHNSVADGKKRRVNACGHPSLTNEVLLPEGSITSSRSCSVPVSAASTMPDRGSTPFNAIKWKSSMLMRMRTEEGIENEEEGN